MDLHRVASRVAILFQPLKATKDALYLLHVYDGDDNEYCAAAIGFIPMLGHGEAEYLEFNLIEDDGSKTLYIDDEDKAIISKYETSPDNFRQIDCEVCRSQAELNDWYNAI
jgi:hypothetical protein